jgi:site-specific recombinase XerD
MHHLTVVDLVPLFITARSYAAASARLRRFQLDRYVAHVGATTRPADVDLVDVLAWWASLDDLAPASRRSAWSAASGFHRWCVDLGIATANPVAAIRRPPEAEQAPNALTVDELGRLWRTLPDDGPVRLAVVLAAGVGLRRSEIVGLGAADVDRSAEPWTLTVHRKGGRVQRVPVESAWVRAELASAPTVGPLVPMRADHLGVVVKRAMRDAGIEGRSLHSLRHFFATNAVRNGRSVREVQRLLGHRSLEHTARYLHV